MMDRVHFHLGDQWETPTEEFVRFMLNQIYDGVKTKNTIEKFEPILISPYHGEIRGAQLPHAAINFLR